jgi:hypothetical protein
MVVAAWSKAEGRRPKADSSASNTSFVFMVFMFYEWLDS